MNRQRIMRSIQRRMGKPVCPECGGQTHKLKTHKHPKGKELCGRCPWGTPWFMRATNR